MVFFSASSSFLLSYIHLRILRGNQLDDRFDESISGWRNGRTRIARRRRRVWNADKGIAGQKENANEKIKGGSVAGDGLLNSRDGRRPALGHFCQDDFQFANRGTAIFFNQLVQFFVENKLF
ncbi:hypothetical protein TcasGA2_TC014569 [Tribolium castaneum]|uniref:Uncharacterized protein n=1 Tax=Tribolium castaneum TaxID=7070 RepID=D6WMJ2_TRICA|nr:hypothetical protein TcasGA2_TC014569 [Tribolium castaneum]